MIFFLIFFSEELEMGLLEVGLVQAISGEFTPEDVEYTLWTYAKMGSEPGERLMGLVEEREETCMNSPKQIVSTLWA